MNLLSGAVVRIRETESVYYRGFLKKKYMRILSGSHWKLSVIERCPY